MPAEVLHGAQRLGQVEAIMLQVSGATDRLDRICEVCGVGRRTAKRLVRSVNQLWHYRARSMGVPEKARPRLLRRAQDLTEKALLAGEWNAAAKFFAMEMQLCGLKDGRTEVKANDPQPLTEEQGQAVEDRVLDRLLSYGSNGHSGNGRAQA